MIINLKIGGITLTELLWNSNRTRGFGRRAANDLSGVYIKIKKFNQTRIYLLRRIKLPLRIVHLDQQYPAGLFLQCFRPSSQRFLSFILLCMIGCYK